MGILTRPLLRPQQRWDLEDLEVGLSALRTDAHFFTKNLLASQSYIVKGFTISNAYLGQPTAQVDLTGATLLNGDNTGDVSWWTAPDSPANLIIPAGASGLQAGRNFVEITIIEEEGTPLQRAFWDPSANSGDGAEFTNEVDTVTELNVSILVNQTSFTGNPNNIPLAIIDLDGSSNIRSIQDRRRLLFRLGEPGNISNDFSWASQTDPATTVTFTSASATAFVSGETVTFTSGATGTVVTGGTNNIEVFNFSSINYVPGDTITGSDSAAFATVLSFYESFSGADKDIGTLRDAFAALATEIKRVKGTNYWPEVGSVISLSTLLNYVNTIVTPISAGARFSWSGTALSITDDVISGQATSDNIAAVRIPGLSSDIYLTRQDGTGGSAPLGISDGSILYVELPDEGNNRVFSEDGTSSTNYRIVAREDFVPNDKNLVLAYRENTKLILKDGGELQTGETRQVGDETTKQQLAFTGAADETDATPPYTTVPDPSLSNQFTTADSLTQAISINAANINDIILGLLKPYEEVLVVVSSVPADDNEVQTNGTALNGRNIVTSGTTITIPLDSRDSNNQKQYVVDSGSLFMFVNGQHWRYGEDYLELGTPGTLSSTIQLLRDLYEPDEVDFRIVVPQFFGASGATQPFFRNEIVGQSGLSVPVGAIYNSGTDKLSVYRNGLRLILSPSVGDAVDRYTEPNNNTILLADSANSPDVFSFINYADPAPSTTLITGLAGTVLTVPTYTLGNGELEVYRNGLLLSTDASAPTDLKYTETSTTSITLDLAYSIDDVFQVYRAGTPPQNRASYIGNTGALLNIITFTNGDARLTVYRNGVLMVDSTIIGDIASRYQQVGTTQLSFSDPLVVADLIEVIYIA